MYPYAKKPEHLTDAEHRLIGRVSDRLLALNGCWETSERVREELRKESANRKQEEEQLRSAELELLAHEKLAIKTRDMAERKKVEKECKEIRARLIKLKEEIANNEQERADIEADNRQTEENIQVGVIQNATILSVVSLVSQILEAKRKDQGGQGQGQGQDQGRPSRRSTRR